MNYIVLVKLNANGFKLLFYQYGLLYFSVFTLLVYVV
ncbi:MAG: hypothetical protein RIS13_1093 [Bacteroidota bacterium]|jgi:hypothetical protein